MKANELRIENYVWDDYSGIMIVMAIGQNNVSLKHTRPEFKAIGGYDLSAINPIPLTEDWLIKFGFTLHHKDYFNEVIYLKNVVDNNSFVWGVYPKKLGSGVILKLSKKIKYVHQLQNLYFALTGKELIIQ